MIFPIKCLTYTLLVNNKDFICWYNKCNTTSKEKNIHFENDLFKYSLTYEHNNMYHDKETLEFLPIDSIKTSLFLNYKDDKYYERIEQKININVNNNYRNKLLFGDKNALRQNKFLSKSNYFLTKNNVEIKYDDLEKDIIAKLENIGF